jgi:hypothetical protein
MARWRGRASLLFVGTLYVPELEYRYLGRQKEIFENGARILDELGMLNPPRATDLRLISLGSEVRLSDPYRRVWETMERLEGGGWHVSGHAICRDNRPPDIVLFCTKDARGEWVVRTTTTPCTSAQYLRNSSKCDSEFSGWHPPEEKQLGAWEADLPPGVLVPTRSGLFQLGRSIFPEEGSTIIWRATVNSPEVRGRCKAIFTAICSRLAPLKTRSITSALLLCEIVYG